MTTYWLQGEKNNPELTSSTTILNEAAMTLSSSSMADKDRQPEQLLSQQANAPSIVRELVEDTNAVIKIDHEAADADKKIEETTPLLTEAASNGATHPL